MTDLPALAQFRLEVDEDAIAHLIFDCPGRTMNVFSDAAIVELGLVARWLGDAAARGLLIRSGKSNAFCAGADLTELGYAYDMVMAAPPRDRFGIAFDHFFRLSSAVRALETSGKPVAAAIGGLALGGGCELALGAHYRVLVDDPKVQMGLPESLVGLLPGSGGTQRLPRLVGLDAALPVLLDGARLGGTEALAAGLVHRLVGAGEEVDAARAWLLGEPEALQPWDRDGWVAPDPRDVGAAVEAKRKAVLAATRGHYPAPLAILDCVAFGLPQPLEGAIRAEMAIFAALIQREEPRNMIQTLFLAKTDYDRLLRKDAIPAFIAPLVAGARAAAAAEDPAILAAAGFPGAEDGPARTHIAPGYWIDGKEGAAATAALARIVAAVSPLATSLTGDERRLADYAIVREVGFPGYLGGPLTLGERRSRDVAR